MVPLTGRIQSLEALHRRAGSPVQLLRVRVTIAAVELLRRSDDPSEAEVRATLTATCAGAAPHNRIVRAVLAAAAELRADRGDTA